jgi:regulator of G-protein signaling
MESLVNEMQEFEFGVVVSVVKHSSNALIYAFEGSDLKARLMKRLNIEESEALNLANQLCLHGYFYPSQKAVN